MLPRMPGTWQLVFCVLLALIVSLAIWDRVQRANPVHRVYPVIGRIPELLRLVARMLRVTNHDGEPFTDADMVEIRRRALTATTETAFGSSRSYHDHPRQVASVSLFPGRPTCDDLISLSALNRENTICVPRLNFGALGFPPVSANTIRAISHAAKITGSLQNTGEDGLHIHVDNSTNLRLVWQIGTGYWDCRDNNGLFDPVLFERRAAEHCVAAIEVKLSQGAKPGMGGYVPAAKNNRYVAKIVGVVPHTDITSPPEHSAFSDIRGLCAFIEKLQVLSRKPVGLKMCAIDMETLKPLFEEFSRSGVLPNFVSIDSGDGGTGGASAELQNSAGLSVYQGVEALDKLLKEYGVRDRVTVFGSGLVKDGFDVFRLVCHGADGAFITRSAMVAMGCVQARRCNLGNCPSGIATQTRWRRTVISPQVQGRQLAAYHASILRGLFDLVRATGLNSASDLTINHLSFADET